MLKRLAIPAQPGQCVTVLPQETHLQLGDDCWTKNTTYYSNIIIWILPACCSLIIAVKVDKYYELGVKNTHRQDGQDPQCPLHSQGKGQKMRKRDQTPPQTPHHILLLRVFQRIRRSCRLLGAGCMAISNPCSTETHLFILLMLVTGMKWPVSQHTFRI